MLSRVGCLRRVWGAILGNASPDVLLSLGKIAVLSWN